MSADDSEYYFDLSNQIIIAEPSGKDRVRVKDGRTAPLSSALAQLVASLL
jgi:hypothetical protein